MKKPKFLLYQKDKLQKEAMKLYRRVSLAVGIVLFTTSFPMVESMKAETASQSVAPFTYQDIDYGFEEESPYMIGNKNVTLFSDNSSTDTISIPQNYRSDQVDVDGVIINFLPPLRNQNQYGTCWSFSALGACEASAIRKGISDNTIDLSERQLAYYFYFKGAETADPLGGTLGDYNQLSNPDEDYLQAGGNNLLTIWHLASWCGPVAEFEAPYSGLYSNKTDINGLMSQPNSTEMAYKKDALHLQNAYVISIGNSYQDETQRQTVQKLIMEYGALGMSYYAQQPSAFDNATYDSYYNNKYYTTNHAVQVVGWDNNFPKENFNKQPDGDGAWLIKNSWGGERSDLAQGGYFWLSYYDYSLRDYNNTKKYAFVFDCEDADNYDNIYQYDGDAGYRGSGFWVYKAANVFQAKANNGGFELLRAVGIGNSYPGASYTLEIYTNLQNEDNPQSGTNVLTQTGSLPYNGYQTIELREPIMIPYGGSYSVVFSFQDATTLYASRTYTNEPWDFQSTENSKQSFVSLSTADKGIGWMDASDNNYTRPCAVRIKAYTDNLKRELELSSYDIDFDHVGDTVILSANTISDNGVSEEVIWESSDENVAQVEPAEGYEDDSRYVKIVAAGYGNCLITAKTEGKSSTCIVKVLGDVGNPTNPVNPTDPTEPEVPTPPGPVNPDEPDEPDQPVTGEEPDDTAALTGLKMSNSSITMVAGKRYSLSAIPTYSTTNIKDDGLVFWKSANPIIATVNSYGEVTAVKPGQTTITVYKGDIQATCLVTVKPQKAKLSSVILTSDKKARLQWKITDGAHGYEIYRTTEYNGRYSKVKTIDKSSKLTVVLQAQKGSKAYFYKIRAYTIISGKKVYGSFSEVKSIAPNGPEIVLIKSQSKKKIYIKWKKSSNANGYVIYRANKKDGTYKKIKTVTAGKTVSYTDKSIIKSNTYYYKIKAFRNVDDKKIYGGYSNTMSTKVDR